MKSLFVLIVLILFSTTVMAQVDTTYLYSGQTSKDTVHGSTYYFGATSSIYLPDTVVSVEIETVRIKVSYPMKWQSLDYVGVKNLWCIEVRENHRYTSHSTYTYYDDKWNKVELPKIYFRWADEPEKGE